MANSFTRGLVKTNRLVIGVMMGVMFVLVFANVVLRYCFGKSIATAEEISTFLMIGVTYLGAGLALRQGRHAAIDLFQDWLPDSLRKGLRILLGVVVLIFFLGLGYYGVLFAKFGWAQETIATQIPQGIPYLAIPIGAFLFALHLILMFRGWIHKKWDAIPIPDEEDSVAEGLS